MTPFRFMLPVAIVALFAIFTYGCGGAVETSDPLVAPSPEPAPLVCKFPSDSYVVTYVELEGTCGPRADSLFNPKAPVEVGCTRGTFFDPQSCDYAVTETCKSECDGTYTESTDKYEVSLLGGSGGNGVLTRIITVNDEMVCTSKYQITFM
jgi:hypothetical protein